MSTLVEADSAFQVLDPATHEVVDEVPDVSLESIDSAIHRAGRAFAEWSVSTAAQRAEVLGEAARLIRASVEDLALTITRESGKSLSDSRSEAETTARYFQWSGEEARRIYGRTIPSTGPERRFGTLRQPVGVVAAITPWNFPMSLVARKLAPALAAGCAVVLRPSSATPLSAIAVGRLLEQAGLPDGVLHIVPTARAAAAGELLATSPGVAKLTFTGGTDVGKHLIALASGTVKRVSMELGGNAPFLVLEHADIEAAVEGILAAKFRCAGQTCTSANRILVHEDRHDEFVDRLVDRVADLRLGHGLDQGVDVGPLINAQARDKVAEHVDEAVNAGAKVALGGHPVQPDGLPGAFFEPTILTDVPAAASVLREETFGPVAPIVRVENDAEAIRRANQTEFGLAAYVYTRDLSSAIRAAEQLQYGIVGVNDPYPFAAQFPMGGWKESGLGFENGTEGIDAFLQTKAVSYGIQA